MAQQQKIDYNILLIAGILFGGYFIGKNILEAFGLKESAEDKAVKAKLKEQETKLNIWSGLASLRKAAGANRKISVLTNAGAKFYAKQINNAFSIVNDDEQQIYAVFRQLRFKTQVASIVSAYFDLYKKDLLTTLKAKLSDKELAEIINIIETKPLGITK